MHFFSSLKSLSIIWVTASMFLGIISASLWWYSSIEWERHLHRSYVAGVVLFENVRAGQKLTEKIETIQLNGQLSKLADAGLFTKLPDVSASDYITQLSLAPQTGNINYKNTTSLAVVSSELKYPLADLKISDTNSVAEKFGDVTRLLASYCSEPILYLNYGDGNWFRVDGNKIWGCKVAPTDLRLLSILLIFISLVILSTLILNTTSVFLTFAENLSKRGVIKGPNQYEMEGPKELRTMIEAINNYLEIEQESLSRRANFLSGVSHDLGTPATRLRLRAQTIKNTEIRDKLNSDIDQMTGMIESVLLYTQSEMKLEELRQISLHSLVDSVVSDFQDANHPVKLIEQNKLSISSRTILFNSQPKLLKSNLLSSRNVIVYARPLSMQRAITNLIDNALKYGRRADVFLMADSQKARIIIDDFGNNETAESLSKLTAPFRRGDNSKNIKGMGIGLAIVSTIAEQHGGSLIFDQWEKGIRAILTIPR